MSELNYRLTIHPDMDNGLSNPWGYGEDILKVKAAAVRLGMAKL